MGGLKGVDDENLAVGNRKSHRIAFLGSLSADLSTKAHVANRSGTSRLARDLSFTIKTKINVCVCQRLEMRDDGSVSTLGKKAMGGRSEYLVNWRFVLIASIQIRFIDCKLLISRRGGRARPENDTFEVACACCLFISKVAVLRRPRDNFKFNLWMRKLQVVSK